MPPADPLALPALDPVEERLNALTHGVGAALGGVATAVLVVLASLRGDPWLVVGVSVFGASLVLLYLASTLYHAARCPRRRRWLRLCDHAAIYLLIAGTYTPFTLVSLRGGWGWTLFGVVWSLAAAGVLFKLLWIGRFPRLSTWLYLGMGWLGVVAAVPMWQVSATSTLAWLVAGGVLYTVGTRFFHATGRWAHPTWHMFVLGGSGCHVLAVATL